MKGLEKLTCIRLAEVLTQKGSIPTETITDALYAQERHNESFVNMLVTGGHISEWDLAKLVVEHFQLPFVMAGNYDIQREVLDKAPKLMLFENLIVPFDRFGDIVAVVMPILTPADKLRELGKEMGCDVYPYVGLISENKTLLGNSFDDFQEWQKEVEVKREKELAARRASGEDGEQRQPGDWMNIFDSGDAEVRSSLGRE